MPPGPRTAQPGRSATVGVVVLAVFAVVLSLVGAFYYLRVIKVMYFDEPTDTRPLESSGGSRLTGPPSG